MRGELRLPAGIYVALLRGVNVGGKNMVSMSSLKGSFGRMGFGGVATYINSGNILFNAKEGDARKLERKIGEMLSSEYQLECKVVVRSYPEMANLVENLPADWTGDGGWKYNVIFLRHTIDSESVLAGLKPRSGIERVLYRPGALLWSVRAGDITRTAWVKLPSQEVYREMTVRNLNTTRKLYELLKRMSES
jgi:uncharacterized protein (DUF1697 family)